MPPNPGVKTPGIVYGYAAAFEPKELARAKREMDKLLGRPSRPREPSKAEIRSALAYAKGFLKHPDHAVRAAAEALTANFDRLLRATEALEDARRIKSRAASGSK